jgi:hypothetical protein
MRNLEDGGFEEPSHHECGEAQELGRLPQGGGSREESSGRGAGRRLADGQPSEVLPGTTLAPVHEAEQFRQRLPVRRILPVLVFLAGAVGGGIANALWKMHLHPSLRPHLINAFAAAA